MGDLDKVSEAIGELKGLMNGHGRKLDELHSELGQLKTQVLELNREGCARGMSNGKRIEKIENRFDEAKQIPLQKKDWGLLTGVTSGVSAIVIGIWKGLEWITSQ